MAMIGPDARLVLQPAHLPRGERHAQPAIDQIAGNAMARHALADDRGPFERDFAQIARLAGRGAPPARRARL
jgi:hypothetical protein